jgi:uncharacterized protein YecE (DUF72 family)
MAAQRVCIGTSGWSYDHWQEVFYPEAVAASQRLAYYQQYFRSVEINSSFYSLPSPASLRHWYESVAGDFVFAVKASRYITHMKKLRDPQRTIKTFMNRVEILQDKLGPILFQLPPRWHVNAERLAALFKILPRDYLYAVEFRDPSWHSERIYELLAKRAVAFCIYDLDGKLSPLQVTADFIYIRLHGPKGPYQGQYSGYALRRWAETIERWRKEKREVYCYFDNDEAAYAVKDAIRLWEMLKNKGGKRPAKESSGRRR